MKGGSGKEGMDALQSLLDIVEGGEMKEEVWEQFVTWVPHHNGVIAEALRCRTKQITRLNLASPPGDNGNASLVQSPILSTPTAPFPHLSQKSETKQMESRCRWYGNKLRGLTLLVRRLAARREACHVGSSESRGRGESVLILAGLPRTAETFVRTRWRIVRFDWLVLTIWCCFAYFVWSRLIMQKWKWTYICAYLPEPTWR